MLVNSDYWGGTGVCSDLQALLAEHKRRGPLTKLTFLGILVDIDTVAGLLSLPPEMLERLITTIED